MLSRLRMEKDFVPVYLFYNITNLASLRKLRSHPNLFSIKKSFTDYNQLFLILKIIIVYQIIQLH